MDPILEQRLQAIEKQLGENTATLAKIRRRQRIAAIMRGLYWAVIIVLSIGSLYYVQPYLSGLIGAYGGTDGTSQSVDGTTSGGSSTSNLMQQLKQLEAIKAQQQSQ